MPVWWVVCWWAIAAVVAPLWSIVTFSGHKAWLSRGTPRRPPERGAESADNLPFAPCVDRAISLSPLAFPPDVGLLSPPALPSWPLAQAALPLDLWGRRAHPPGERARIDRRATFLPPLFPWAIRDRVGTRPAHTPENHRSLAMAAPEVHRLLLHLTSRGGADRASPCDGTRCDSSSWDPLVYRPAALVP
jgi:hypothetical protein